MTGRDRSAAGGTGPGSRLLEAVVAEVGRARRIVVFSGAGISTDAGIPDYRGSGGQHERYQPVMFDDFVSSIASRVAYWTHKAGVWPAIRDAQPAAGHHMVAQLARSGRLQGVITQNIDGLHERSGIAPEFIVNLHGSNLAVVCLDCEARRPAGEVLDPLADLQRPLTPEDVPRCSACGGLLKPATVMFGQALPAGELARAEALLAGCDLLIAIGSTLTVQPAASIPLVARANGARLMIVTRGETPLDSQADLRYDGDISSVAVAVSDALARPNGPSSGHPESPS